MLKIYGITASRTFRPRWMLEELGLDYEQVNLDYRGPDLQSEQYLALNPNGRIPTLVDGDLVLWESMAINLYLAGRYGADTTELREHPLWPSTAQGQGLAYQWSFWVSNELESPLLSVLFHKRLLPAEQRDADKLSRNLGCVQRPLDVLEQALSKRDWLAADHFSVADLNVASVLSWAKAARLDLDERPRLKRWLGESLDRPAAKSASGR